MATYEITAEINLKKIIAEAKEVTQVLNEFADNLERIENKYAEKQESERLKKLNEDKYNQGFVDGYKDASNRAKIRIKIIEDKINEQLDPFDTYKENNGLIKAINIIEENMSDKEDWKGEHDA